MTLLHVSTPWLITIATALSVFSIWVVVSMIGAKGRILLLSFVVVAGIFSAWFSQRHPQSAWFIFVTTLALAVLAWALFHKLGKNTGPDLDTWRTYLGVQGALLALSLAMGGAIAWIGVANGPYPGRPSTGGQLVKFENLDPSQHPVYQEVDVANYSEISVLTKTGAPANSSATVAIYLDHGDAAKLEFGHLDSESNGWSRWTQANTGKHMSLVVGPPTRAGAVPATQVDILVYLSPK
jgi:hypothetical protein